MKINSLIIVLCVCSLSSNAQVNFGVNAGANMGNIVTKYDGKKDEDIKSAVGYIVSGDVNIPIGTSLVFQTGLQYESIHNKVNTEEFMDFGFGFTTRSTFTGNHTLIM